MRRAYPTKGSSTLSKPRKQEATAAIASKVGYLCRVYSPEGQRAFMPKGYGHPTFLWEAGSAEAALNQIEDEIHADALDVFDPSSLYRPVTDKPSS